MLSLVWPPTDIPPDKPIFWLRYSDGRMIYLETETQRVVPLFITAEATRVVAIALKNRFGLELEIRAVTGISRPDFECGLRKSGELPQWNGTYVILWEDIPDFVHLLTTLGVTVLSK